MCTTGCIGHIFNIQHFSIHDGPGIRTTIFLKGCNLHCLWCHNPEGQLLRPMELSFVPSRCIGCGYCFQVCPHHCHSMEDGTHKLDWNRCARCGLCVKECPSKALTTLGKSVTADEVLCEVLRDNIFYQTSGGGITLSGGEPVLQRDFLLEVLKKAKAAGLHTALETCLAYDYNALDEIKENVDLFLADYKITDPQKHKQYIGVDPVRILANLQRLHDEGKNVLLRCPIILGVNDEETHFKKIAELTRKFPRFMGAELLPYHRLGVAKVKRFGLEDAIPHAEYKTPSRQTEQRWIDVVRSYGGRLVNENVV